MGDFPEALEREAFAMDFPGEEMPAKVNTYDDKALHLEEPEPTITGPEAEKQARWRAAGMVRKMQRRDAQQVSKAVLGFMEGIAVVALGPKASMLDYEKEMMREPLERILLRLDVINAEFISKWSDPAVLIMLIGAYVSRVVKEEDEEEEKPISKPREEKPTAKPSKREPVRAPSKVGDTLITEQTKTPSIVKEGYPDTGIKL